MEVGKAWSTSILFQLETDDLELTVDEINLNEFSEVENNMNAMGLVGQEDDDEDDFTPDIKLLWANVKTLKHLTPQQQEKLADCFGQNHNTFLKS